MAKCYAQGDVLLVMTNKKKAPGVKQPHEQPKRVILEHGEATGHTHRLEVIEKDGQENAALYLDAARRYLEVCYQSDVVHEEHDRVPLAPAIYEVRRQCTWSVLEQMATQVID